MIRAVLTVASLALLSSYASGNNATELLSSYDLNSDGVLNATELEEMTEVIDCSNTAHLVITGLAEDGDAADGVSTSFMCTRGGHGHDEHEDEDEHHDEDEDEDEHHDEDEDEDEHHDEDEDEHDEPAAFLDLEIGESEWSCVAEEIEADEGSTTSKATAWGLTLLAVTLTTLIAVIGILFINVASIEKYVHQFQSFAAGALIAAALLHMLPEAFAEVGLTWKGGAVLMFGYVFTLLVERAIRYWRSSLDTSAGVDSFGHAHHHPHGSHSSAGPGKTAAATADALPGAQATGHVEASDPVTAAEGAGSSDAVASPVTTLSPDADGTETPASVRAVLPTGVSQARLTDTAITMPGEFEKRPNAGVPLSKADPIVWVVLVGDFIHNFVDGIAIASAFLGCSKSFGWSVTLAIALHEIPQEIGDYFVLVLAGLSKRKALGFNLLSALGAFIGAIFVLTADTLDHELNGYLILFSAGTLLFIGTTDLIPDTLHDTSAKGSFWNTFWLLAAAVLVGLTLIHDKHCESSIGGGDAHAH